MATELEFLPPLGRQQLAQPRGLYVLFFTEMWERFSFYGMRALLVYACVRGLHWSPAAASDIYGLYTGSVYLTSILGGWLSDRFLGGRRAIGMGAGLMALGHGVLALESPITFFAGLLLLALGCGLFKPNISICLGGLYGPGDPRRTAGFSLFYMGINLGAFIAPLVCGTLGEWYGWRYGFLAAGAGMLISWGIFSLGWHDPATFAVRPEDGLRKNSTPHATPTNQAAPLDKAPRINANDRWLILIVLGLANIVFWAAFEQAGSSLALFVAKGVDLHLAPGGFLVPASWYQALNPIAIIVLSPCVAKLWRSLAARGREPLAPAKFVVGLALMAANFWSLALLGRQSDQGALVPLASFLVPTVLATFSELCISPVGLALVSEIALPSQAALTMGLWFGSTAVGNFLAGMLASHFDELSHTAFFARFAGLLGASAALLWLTAPALTRRLQPKVSSAGKIIISDRLR